MVIVLRESGRALADVLPTGKDVEDFFAQITASRGENGLTLSKLTPKTSGGPKSASKVFEKISYTVKVSGSLWQFVEYLSRIESFRRFVMVPRFKLTGGSRDKAAGEVIHEAEFDVETYAYNPSKAPTVEPIPGYEKRREGRRGPARGDRAGKVDDQPAAAGVARAPQPGQHLRRPARSRAQRAEAGRHPGRGADRPPPQAARARAGDGGAREGAAESTNFL